MELVWYESESSVSPELEEVTPTTAYLRKDVEEITVEATETEEAYTKYVYQECKMSRQDYADYKHAQSEADISYVALMTGVDL